MNKDDCETQGVTIINTSYNRFLEVCPHRIVRESTFRHIRFHLEYFQYYVTFVITEPLCDTCIPDH